MSEVPWEAWVAWVVAWVVVEAGGRVVAEVQVEEALVAVVILAVALVAVAVVA